MTPKEKAKDLVDKMYMLDDPNGNYPMCFDVAKQCALVAVDEILSANHIWYKGTIPYNYWEQVKQEIEAL